MRRAGSHGKTFPRDHARLNLTSNLLSPQKHIIATGYESAKSPPPVDVRRSKTWTDATTPSIVGPTILGVVAPVLAEVYKRKQLPPT